MPLGLDVRLPESRRQTGGPVNSFEASAVSSMAVSYLIGTMSMLWLVTRIESFWS